MSEARVGRRTPYEIAFGEERFAREEFPRIADEADRRGLATSDDDQFARLTRVATLLEGMVPDECDPAVLGRYMDVLYHGFHFWQAGCRFYAFEEAAVRSLVETPPDLTHWAPRAPAPSIYIELPMNVFWAAVTEEAAPEPVEGLFVRLDATEWNEVRVLAVLGIRPDRPGFSVVPLMTRLERPLAAAEPRAFRSELPGAELAGLYSLRRSDELISLLACLLWYLDTYPDSTARVEGVSEEGVGVAGHLQSTALEHHRVSLIERSRG